MSELKNKPSKRNKSAEGLTTRTIKTRLFAPVEIQSNNKVLQEIMSKTIYHGMFKVLHQTRDIANFTILKTWDYHTYSLNYRSRYHEFYKEKFGLEFESIKREFPREKKVVQLQADISNLVGEHYKSKNEALYLTGMNKALLIFNEINSTNNHWKDVLRGEREVQYHGKHIPLDIKMEEMSDGKVKLNGRRKPLISKINNEYYIKIHLFSEEAVKDLQEFAKEKYEEIKEDWIKKNKDMTFIDFDIPKIPSWLTFKLGNKKNTEFATIEKIMSGEYELSASKIIYDKQKRKWVLSLGHSFKPNKINSLDKNKILGIDVGVAVPATLGVSDDSYYRKFVGDGKEIRDFENQVIARKKRIQESRKWAGKGSIGHGIKCRTKAVDKISGKIANFKQTKNHNWSRFIIDEAVRLGCGTIQMEDLTGISEENTFLKTWTYYQLQQYITYKAEEVGIEVVVVNPKYTSSRCNKCGIIHFDNRTKEEKKNSKPKWRPTQDTFHCQTCNHKVNADVNAARNIAMKDIEKIIENQVKLQQKASNHALKYIAE